MTPPTYLTVREASERMGVSRMTVYRLIHDELLRAYRVRRSFRIAARDVDSFMRDANTVAWERPGGAA